MIDIESRIRSGKINFNSLMVRLDAQQIAQLKDVKQFQFLNGAIGCVCHRQNSKAANYISIP